MQLRREGTNEVLSRGGLLLDLNVEDDAKEHAIHFENCLD